MLDLYADFLVRSAGTDLNGVKVVLDCANGALYIVAEKVYRALGADVRMIGNDPNGLNINNGCGSTHPEKLQREVVRSDALIGGRSGVEQPLLRLGAESKRWLLLVEQTCVW